MFANAKLITIFVAVLSVNVDAQSTTSSAATPPSSAIPECLLTCYSTGALVASCNGFVDLQCVCPNTDFQDYVRTCVVGGCSLDEQAASIEILKTQCAPYVTSSSSPTRPASTSYTSSTSSTTYKSSSGANTSPTAPGAYSSSAAMGKVQFGYGGLVGAAVAFVGAVVGAVLTL